MVSGENKIFSSKPVAISSAKRENRSEKCITQFNASKVGDLVICERSIKFRCNDKFLVNIGHDINDFLSCECPFFVDLGVKHKAELGLKVNTLSQEGLKVNTLFQEQQDYEPRWSDILTKEEVKYEDGISNVDDRDVTLTFSISMSGSLDKNKIQDLVLSWSNAVGSIVHDINTKAKNTAVYGRKNNIGRISEHGYLSLEGKPDEVFLSTEGFMDRFLAVKRGEEALDKLICSTNVSVKEGGIKSGSSLESDEQDIEGGIKSGSSLESDEQDIEGGIKSGSSLESDEQDIEGGIKSGSSLESDEQDIEDSIKSGSSLESDEQDYGR